MLKGVLLSIAVFLNFPIAYFFVNHTDVPPYILGGLMVFVGLFLGIGSFMLGEYIERKA